MSLPENQGKTVVVNYVKKKEITITITDCGVAMAKISSFDQIEYMGVGDSVKCTVLL